MVRKNWGSLYKELKLQNSNLEKQLIEVNNIVQEIKMSCRCHSSTCNTDIEDRVTENSKLDERVMKLELALPTFAEELLSLKQRSAGSYDAFSTPVTEDITYKYEAKMRILELQYAETDQYSCTQGQNDKSSERTGNDLPVYISVESLQKEIELQEIVDSLYVGDKISVEKCEMFKLFIEKLENQRLSANSEKAVINNMGQIASDSLTKKDILDIIAQQSISPERFEQLGMLVDNLAETTVSHDYMDETLKNGMKKCTKELQIFGNKILVIENKNTQIETKCKELAEAISKATNENRNTSIEKFEKKIKILKDMQSENDTYKELIEKNRDLALKNLNKNILRMIHKSVAKQIQSAKFFPVLSQEMAISNANLLLTFNISQLKGSNINILSFSSTDQLLAGCCSNSQMYVYSRGGCHISIVTITKGDNLYDASWTPCGNIVYTTNNCENNDNGVVVMSEFGKVISRTQLTAPRYLTVSDDNTIYLTDFEMGVYQSTDDGLHWTLVIERTDKKWYCRQIIKQATDYSDNFWALECNNDYSSDQAYRLRKYSMQGNNLTWVDINLPKNINLHYCSSLAYDDNANILFNNYDSRTIYTWSLNKLVYNQELSPDDITKKPYKLIVDAKRQQLYVGQNDGIVEIFKLSHKEIDD